VMPGSTATAGRSNGNSRKHKNPAGLKGPAA